MEVHPPEHPIHTWRDFFIHIATIVVGLLIAIALEQSVEALHHRHQVHVAHRNLAAEARGNEAKLRQNEQTLRNTERELEAALAQLRAMEKTPSSAPNTALTASWSWQDFDNSAYDTARDTGVFALMPYEQVQEIDGDYRQQQYVYDAMVEYVRSIYRVHQALQGGRTLADLSPAETIATADACSAALSNLQLLQQLMRNLGSGFHELATE